MKFDQIIAETLGAEPDFKLPADFTQKVISTLTRSSQLRSDLLDYLYLMIFLILLLVIVSGAYYLINKEVLMQVITLININIKNVVFVTILVNFVYLVDRVLLRLFFSKLKIN
jgi:hypothetical protein